MGGNEISKPSSDLAACDVTDALGIMEVRDLDGAVMCHPDGRPFTITYRSKDSEVFRNLSMAQTDRRIAQNSRTNQAVKSAIIERDNIELLVAVTVEWDIILDGEAPPSAPNEYRAAYTKYRALMEQGDQFVGVRANFTKR